MMLCATPVSEGYSYGQVFVLTHQTLSPAAFCPAQQSPQQEQARYLQASRAVKEDLVCLQESNGTDAAASAVLQAYLELVQDEGIREEAERRIAAGSSAEQAVWEAFETVICLLEALPDAHLCARSADMKELRDRLITALDGHAQTGFGGLCAPAVLVTDELLACEAAQLDKTRVLGVVAEKGSVTSHAAILLRSQGIPAVFGVQNVREAVKNKPHIALDACAGQLWLNPSAETVCAIQQKAQQYSRALQNAQQFAHRLATTKDGWRIETGINIEDASFAVEEGFDTVGLFRTEFLFMEKAALPTEEEQFEVYRKVLEKGKPVTLRTLDVGADKALPYLQASSEENPALGQRALRFCLAQPDVFETQLRAVLRAALYGEVRLLLPMVSNMEEIEAAKRHIRCAAQQLQQRGVPFQAHVPVGIMVEIPAIALIADTVAQAVDFACIGTNDLCQYLTAADRHNALVAACYQQFHPGLLRMVLQVVRAFGAAQKPVSVCGEMCGQPAGAAALAAMEVWKISAAPARLPAIKQMFAQHTREEFAALQEKLLNAATQQEVLAVLQAFIQE